MFLGILTLLSALSISAVAAYFSIIGLAVLFAAAFWPVVLMGSVLEIGKLVSAAWLHKNWTNPEVNKLHKIYLTIAILLLMLITSMGIFGYLSKGHLEQNIPVQELSFQIEKIDEEIAKNNRQIERYNEQLKQLDRSIDVFLKNDRASQGLAARRRQEAERTEIKDNLKILEEKNNQLNSSKIDLRNKSSMIEAKLGPIKYIGELLFTDGIANTDSAVRFVILMIIFAFDPLAVLLVISASITLSRDKHRNLENYPTYVPGTDDIKNDLSLLKEKSQNLENTVIHIEEKVKDTDNQTIFLKEKIETFKIVEEKTIDLEKSVDILNEKISKTTVSFDEKINSVDVKILEKTDSLDQKIISLNENHNKSTDEISNKISETVVSLNEKIESVDLSLTESIKIIDEKTIILEKSIDEISDKIVETSDSINQKIDSEKENRNKLVDELNNKISEKEVSLNDKIETVNSYHVTSLRVIEEKTNDLENSIDTLSEKISETSINLNEKIDLLEESQNKSINIIEAKLENFDDLYLNINSKLLYAENKNSSENVEIENLENNDKTLITEYNPETDVLSFKFENEEEFSIETVKDIVFKKGESDQAIGIEIKNYITRWNDNLKEIVPSLTEFLKVDQIKIHNSIDQIRLSDDFVTKIETNKQIKNIAESDQTLNTNEEPKPIQKDSGWLDPKIFKPIN